MCAQRNPFSPRLCRRSKRPHSPPGTPGPHLQDNLFIQRQQRYPSASPASVKKLPDFKQALFLMPELRCGKSTTSMDVFPLDQQTDPAQPPPRPVHVTPPSDGSSASQEFNVTHASQDEPEEANSPRARARRPAAPDLEDALTRLTQTVQQMVACQRPQQAAAPVAVEEDPAFQWHALRSPLEATFPLPPTGVVQRVAAGLFAKVQSGVLTGRDQREARFVLDVLADWPEMDDELRTRVFQRLNIYAIVATHGWATAIAASAASHNDLQCVLPPGVQPVVQRQQNQQQRQGGRRRNADAPAPPPPAQQQQQPAQPANRQGRRRRNN